MIPKSGKIKVLYIAGEGRSGSTILGNILGQVEGFFHIGELRQVWIPGFIQNMPCGCGVPFRECPVWRAIFEKAFGGTDQIDLEELFQRYQDGSRTRHIPRVLLPGGNAFLKSRLGIYLPTIARLYRAIRDVTASEVIVDSTKRPIDAFVLKIIPDLDLYIVHLIRDSRAVAYSWTRKKRQTGTDQFLPRRGPAQSSLTWNLFNFATPLLQTSRSNRYLRLRYEDFVDNPRTATKNILDFIGRKSSTAPFVSDREAELTTNHGIMGNPDKFNVGRIMLRADTEWEAQMSRWDWLSVTMLTWPWLLQYGYPILCHARKK